VSQRGAFCCSLMWAFFPGEGARTSTYRRLYAIWTRKATTLAIHSLTCGAPTCQVECTRGLSILFFVCGIIIDVKSPGTAPDSSRPGGDAISSPKHDLALDE
jgi:hypothetical protein